MVAKAAQPLTDPAFRRIGKREGAAIFSLKSMHIHGSRFLNFNLSRRRALR